MVLEGSIMLLKSANVAKTLFIQETNLWVKLFGENSFVVYDVWHVNELIRLSSILLLVTNLIEAFKTIFLPDSYRNEEDTYNWEQMIACRAI